MGDNVSTMGEPEDDNDDDDDDDGDISVPQPVIHRNTPCNIIPGARGNKRCNALRGDDVDVVTLLWWWLWFKHIPR